MFVAFGLAGILVGIFAGWVWIAAGAALGLLALRRWVADIADDLHRLPRDQDLTTAPLPATPMRTARAASAAATPTRAGSMPEVAPSEVQTRTMSRIESMPTSSLPSATTRWRMWRRDISIAARSRLQSGAAEMTVSVMCAPDELGVGVLAPAHRVEHVTLGDHAAGPAAPRR